MNDFRDLKAIAEACQQHQPLRFMPSHGALYIRNDNGIVFDVHQNRSFPEFMAQNKDYADLVLAANPATVLALIAEIEALRERSMSAWHVMADASPPYRQRVLVFLPEYGDQVTASLQEPDQFFATDFFEFDDLDCIEAHNIGHWMPLPADPEVTHD